MLTDPVMYKRVKPVQIAAINAHIFDRAEIPPILSRLRDTCKNSAAGDAMAIFHEGASKDGVLIEAAIPVLYPVETEDVHTRILEPVPVLAILHKGSHQSIPDTMGKIYTFKRLHAWSTSLLRREVYKVLDAEQPDNNLTEVQIVLHEWDKLLVEATERILGAEASRQIGSGIDSITVDTSFADYTAWIQGAISRLDAMNIDQEKKCQIVSHCAHVFPQERIDHLRGIYQQDGIDAILQQMYTDDFWYEKPVRRGNVLYMRKNPYNPEAYQNAQTPAERRKAYCHCAFVHPYLDNIPSGLSPTFCYCGAGWYRRLWEGILGQPVQFEHVETLLRGNDQCTFNITLPLELSGEFSPQTIIK